MVFGYQCFGKHNLFEIDSHVNYQDFGNGQSRVQKYKDKCRTYAIVPRVRARVPPLAINSQTRLGWGHLHNYCASWPWKIAREI